MRTARLTPWVLVGPALALVTVFVALPVVAVAALTLLRVDLLGGSVSFTGLQNLATETTDPEFGRALANTLLYTVYTVGPSVAGGLAAALLIHGSGRGAAFWRGAYFLPAACTLVAMAGVWRWMFAADAGVIDRLLAPVLGLRDWLGDPSLALVALAVVGVWHQVGLVAVIYLAALANVNPDSLDSARLDGAGPGGRFRHVVWPTLGPTTVFVLVLMIGNALQAYDTVAAMTRGGPLGATQTLTYVMWVRGIEYFDLGRAAVLAVVLLVAALAVALGAGRVLDTVTTENYALVWREQPIAMFYAHSALVAACTVLFQLAICIPAAFAMSRLRFVGRQAWSVATTALLVVPFQVVAVPVYLLLREVGLVDTLAALILPFVGSALALVLLRQAFMTLPTEMLDAARLDGAGTAALLWRVVVPSSRPAIAALAVLTLTAAWNAYFWPSFVLTDASRATVPFGLVAYLNTESGSRYGPQMAMATLSVLPLLAVFLLLQRHLVRGLTTAGQPG